jgi:hypothetical protein
MRPTELFARARSNDTLTSSDKLSYLQYLGLTPNSDLHFLVDSALSAPLPEDWSEHFDQKDRIYYYNSASDQSSWIHPLESELRKIIVTSSQNTSTAINALSTEIHALDRSLYKIMNIYSEHEEKGKRFFFNKETRRSSWTDPRLAVLFMLKVKGQVVEVLNARQRQTKVVNPIEPKTSSEELKLPRAGHQLISPETIGSKTSSQKNTTLLLNAGSTLSGPKRKAGLGVKLAPIHS